MDIAGGPHGELEALLDVAALDEVLVGLWVVEAAHDGPHRVWWREDALREEGGALAGGCDGVGVVLQHGGFEVLELFSS